MSSEMLKFFFVSELRTSRLRSSFSAFSSSSLSRLPSLTGEALDTTESSQLTLGPDSHAWQDLARFVRHFLLQRTDSGWGYCQWHGFQGTLRVASTMGSDRVTVDDWLGQLTLKQAAVTFSEKVALAADSRRCHNGRCPVYCRAKAQAGQRKPDIESPRRQVQGVFQAGRGEDLRQRGQPRLKLVFAQVGSC